MNNRPAEVNLGATSRNSRFKRDTINIHMEIFDENREKPVDTYKYLTNILGEELRKELGITKKDLKDESKSTTKATPPDNKAKGKAKSDT